jgi:hypothetical protein
MITRRVRNGSIYGAENRLDPDEGLGGAETWY